jgi:dipeptidase
MKNALTIISLVAAVVLQMAAAEVRACTNFLVSKKASADGSTFITYAADSHELYGELYHTAGGVHLPGEEVDVIEWDTGKLLGRIDQAPRTYTVVGNMNEHQVSIGETTWGGREELSKNLHPEAIVDYGSLMYLALQRSRTAREAIEVMAGLTDEYGYASVGETFSIADPREVWIMEMVGKGKEDKGAVWVARRVPDGYVAAHANQARIRTFPLGSKGDTLYSEDVISFARKMGWYDGADKDFSFADTYAPMTFDSLRFCEARVWQFFRRVAPSLKLGFDMVSGEGEYRPLPLWVKPDRKLSARDVMELMRDHFEGSELDLSKGVGAGPYSLPYRWRPMVWKHGGKKYLHERATSTQQTGFSFVAQMRSWLPPPVGGVLWFGVDDTFSTVYVPMYCAIREAPEPYAVGTGDFEHFTWDSAFWVFNAVSNQAYSRYSEMIIDIQREQRNLEGRFLAEQVDVDRTAVKLLKTAPGAALEHLTRYSAESARITVDRWRELWRELFVKYLDGNVRDSTGKITHPPYPDHWYKRIVDENGDLYRMRLLPGEPEPKEEE